MSMALRRTSPERQGVSSGAVTALLRDLEALGGEIHGLMIARNDCVIAESWMHPYGAEIPHSCHSLGKSYTCTAVGLACTDGLLSPDDRLVDIFHDEIKEWAIAVSPGMEKVTVRHLMTMSSGTRGMPTFDHHWLENFLASPMEHEPGEKFYYNTTGSCVLGAVVEKVTGENLLGYMRRRLFDFIGIDEKDIVWQKFANGFYAEPGLCATTEANLRLGLFYLHGGRVGEQQLIDEKWMTQATSCQIATSATPDPEDDGTHGYGWQLWLGSVPGLYRFDGGQGQLCFVYPQKNCVVAIHQAGHDPYGVAGCIRLVQRFMQALPDGTLEENPAALQTMKNFLTNRQLKEQPSIRPAAEAGVLCGVYRVVTGQVQPWIEVVPIDEDFWHYFYDPAVNARVETLEIRLDNYAAVVTFNGRSRIRARLDGIHQLQQVPNVLPGLEAVSAVAHVEENSVLHVSLRWLNGWFKSEMHFVPDGTGGMSIEIEKDMLHDLRDKVRYTAYARKIAL